MTGNAGYSATSLARKLGLKDKFKIKIVNQPPYYFKLFTDLPQGIEEAPGKDTMKDFIHYFAKSTQELENDLGQLKQEIKQNGMIWVSWPKKSAQVPTGLDGNIVREIGLRNGLVDIKVCAIDEIWSGLKFVVPVKDRA